MSKEKNEKKASKRIMAMILIIALPVLSLAIGFYGIQFLMNQSGPSEPINETPKATTKELLEKEVSKTVETVKSEPVESVEPEKQQEVKETFTYQMPSISTYNIQVGSYSESVNANKMVTNISQLGYGGYVYKSDIYKVFIMTYLNRANADVNKVISEQVFPGAYITEIQIQPKEIKYLEADKNYIHTLKQDSDIIVEILNSYTQYVHTFELSSFDKDDFSVYLITQHNEVTKLKDKITAQDVSDELKEQQIKLVEYLERIETQFEDLINIENPSQKEIWDGIIKIIFDYAELV